MTDRSRSRRVPSRRTTANLAVAAIVANVGIVVSGGIVRLTGSGLGCPDWPTCDGTRILPGGQDLVSSGVHQAIEFGNRLMTFVVLAAVVAVFVAVWRRRRADPPLEDRTTLWLAASLPVGVLGQAVLGGVAVLTGLHWSWVAAHFLLSAVLIGLSVALHDRVRDVPVDAPASTRVRVLAGGLVVLGALVLVLGTLVTAAGPHAGDPGTPRLAIDIRDIAKTHAGAVWVTVATSLAVLWLARRGEAGTDVRRAAAVLLGVELVQAGIGYLQYALGIPEWLVALHLLAACLFWVAVVRVGLAAHHVPVRPPVPSGDRAAAAVG